MMYKFYLNFKNDATGLVEISEPVGFDAANFVIEQDKKRYGRDVYYGSEETNLTFYKGLFENANLTHQFEKLTRFYKDYGFESEVEFIVEVNGVALTVGLLDFQKAETDQLEYFKTKVIQNTQIALVKRRSDVKVDVFATKDLDDKVITPVGTSRILLKSKPVKQSSQWRYDAQKFYTGGASNYFYSGVGGRFFFINRTLLDYGIEDSVTPFDPYAGSVGGASTKLFIIKTKGELSDLTLNYKLKATYKHVVNNNPDPNGNGTITSLTVYYGILRFGGAPLLFSDLTTVFEIRNTENFNVTTNIDEDITIDINETLLDGDQLCFFYEYLYTQRTHDVDFLNLSRNSHIIFDSSSIEISATSTSIDSVIEGVRHIDYIKQNFKAATGQTVIAPKYDVGGIFYDNFVFNGKLIRQRTDEPFYATIKENTEQLDELNADYQVNNNNIYIGQYSDFYPNNEIGAFLTAPDDSFKASFNDRYTVQTLEYKYKNYEQDKDVKNTVDAIHTDTQWLLPNKQVEGNLKKEIPFTRDPFSIERARREGIDTTTSLSSDDRVYIIDVMALPAGSRNSFTRVLSYQYSDANNTFKILSNQSFNWLLLGFEIGDTVKINTIDYVVENIENTILTLTYSGASNATGEMVITVDYPLTAVDFVNRTNEGFTLIENILTGENFSNLRYSIKRNLKHWYPYLKTCCKFAPVGKIKNTFFKSNKDATTKFGPESVVVEGTDILVSELGDAILTPYIYSGKLIANFEDVKSVLDKIQQKNIDNSIGGFIRTMDNNFKVTKVFVQKLDYTFATAELATIGEEMQESEFLTINKIGDNLIVINEIGYDPAIIKPLQLRTNGNYIQILDARGVGLNNEIKYDKVKVNSIIFSNIVELSENLLNGL